MPMKNKKEKTMVTIIRRKIRTVKRPVNYSPIFPKLDNIVTTLLGCIHYWSMGLASNGLRAARSRNFC